MGRTWPGRARQGMRGLGQTKQGQAGPGWAGTCRHSGCWQGKGQGGAGSWHEQDKMARAGKGEQFDGIVTGSGHVIR